MYTVQNFKTKKALKEALKAGDEVSFFQPNQMFPMKVLNPDYTGKIALEGPHYPQPHSWYALGNVINGKLVSVS